MGWGQVAQHRSFGHKGGLGRSGHLKHLASTVIKEDQDHLVMKELILHIQALQRFG